MQLRCSKSWARTILCLCLLFVTTVHAESVLLVMGDSLSAEYGLATGTGWVALLQHKLTQDGFAHQVINASISGETSAGGRARIREALTAHRPAVVIVALGANDGLRGQPVAMLRGNLEFMIKQSQKRGARVMLVGQRLPPNYGAAYNRRFEAAFSEAATRTTTPLVPFMLAGFATDRSMFQQDGLHPTAAAQSRIVDTVYPTLKPLLKK